MIPLGEDQGPNDVIDLAYGLTRLHVAAREGDLAYLEYLIQNGANVNVKSSGGRGACDETPMHWARTSDVVLALLAAGAVRDAPAALGQIALHSLAFRNRVEAVKAVLKAGADVNQTDLRLGVRRQLGVPFVRSSLLSLARSCSLTTLGMETSMHSTISCGAALAPRMEASPSSGRTLPSPNKTSAMRKPQNGTRYTAGHVIRPIRLECNADLRRHRSPKEKPCSTGWSRLFETMVQVVTRRRTGSFSNCNRRDKGHPIKSPLMLAGCIPPQRHSRVDVERSGGSR